MKKIPLSLLVSLTCCFWACTNTDHDQKINTTEVTTTTPSTTSVTTDSSVAPIKPIETPKGYTLLGEAQGDLDKDKIPEKVIVYDTPRSGDFGTEREIYIYKKEGPEWKLWHRSTGAVLPSENGGMMGDPFEGVSIENGCIVLNHFGGSREKWNYTHRFRYQNDQWCLIGATSISGAPCEHWDTFDYNLSSGKAIYKKELESCNGDEAAVTVVQDRKEMENKLAVLPNMDGFAPGENKIKFPKSPEEFYY